MVYGTARVMSSRIVVVVACSTSSSRTPTHANTAQLFVIYEWQ